MSRLARAARVSRRAARKLAPAFVACVLAIALVFGGLRSGAHYFFCAAMGSLTEKACCTPAAHDDAPFESATLGDDGDDCCERLDLGRLPASAAGRVQEPIRSAPLLAVLAPLDVAGAVARELARLHQLDADPPTRRAGASPPPTAPERCALQGVFLI